VARVKAPLVGGECPPVAATGLLFEVGEYTQPEDRATIREFPDGVRAHPESPSWSSVLPTPEGSLLRARCDCVVAAAVHDCSLGNLRRIRNAGTTDRGARTQGPPRRQGAVYTGGGVRAWGDRAHPRREARRAIDEAGDCHRALEGQARRRAFEAAAEGTGVGSHEEECREGLPRRPERSSPCSFDNARAGGKTTAEARAAAGGVSRRALETGTILCQAAAPDFVMRWRGPRYADRWRQSWFASWSPVNTGFTHARPIRKPGGAATWARSAHGRLQRDTSARFSSSSAEGELGIRDSACPERAPGATASRRACPKPSHGECRPEPRAPASRTLAEPAASDGTFMNSSGALYRAVARIENCEESF